MQRLQAAAGDSYGRREDEGWLSTACASGQSSSQQSSSQQPTPATQGCSLTLAACCAVREMIHSHTHLEAWQAAQARPHSDARRGEAAAL